MHADPVRELGNTYARIAEQNYPLGGLINLYQYYSQRLALNEAMAQRDKFTFGATSHKDQPLSIVIIIGESSRRANWQLSGYHRQTNPELSANEGVIYFSEAISAATQTRESIQLALTRATPGNTAPINSEKSIISAFKEAGFRTAWFSNQNRLSGVDTPLYVIAKETDHVYFTNGDYKKSSRFDEELITPLEDYLSNTQDPRRLIVIHTMGSHEVYRQRYPQDFATFQPASTGDDYNFASAGIRERLLNSYDNSILYSDHVLNRLLGVIDKHLSNSLVVYFSDHGENILDDQNRRFGHGGVIPTRFVTEIPCFSGHQNGSMPAGWSCVTDCLRTVKNWSAPCACSIH